MSNWPQVDRSQSAQRMVGIILVIISLVLAGCSAASIPTEPNRPSPLSTPTLQEPLPANPSATPVPPQMLRVTNQSAFNLRGLRVRFPDETVEFGDVLPGATTEYHVFSRGIYRYAAYNVEVDGQVYQQPVIDWVGEIPMNGKAFTYILDVDPTHWKTEGWVIRLVEVKEDPSNTASISKQAAIDAALKIASSSRPEISSALVTPRILQIEQISLSEAEQRLHGDRAVPGGYGPEIEVWYIALRGLWASEASAPGVTPSITQAPYHSYMIILNAQTGLEIDSSLRP